MHELLLQRLQLYLTLHVVSWYELGGPFRVCLMITLHSCVQLKNYIHHIYWTFVQDWLTSRKPCLKQTRCSISSCKCVTEANRRVAFGQSHTIFSTFLRNTYLLVLVKLFKINQNDIGYYPGLCRQHRSSIDINLVPCVWEEVSGIFSFVLKI